MPTPVQKVSGEMDPNKESMTNAAKAERDSENNRNSRESPKESLAQLGRGDMNIIFPARPQNPWQNSPNTTFLQRQKEPRPLNSDARAGRSSEPACGNYFRATASNHSSTNAFSNSNGEASTYSLTNCNNCPTPGSSGTSSATKNKLEHNQPLSNSQSADADNVRENRKRPSSLKLNRPDMEDDDSSISDYSLGSEDGCIYTYRGGEHLADLPSSFFSLDMGLPADQLALPNYAPQPAPASNARENGPRSRPESPDMDFLEMDFDPGPSNEVDSGEESTNDADLEAAMEMPEENEPVRLPSPIVAKCIKPTSNVQPSGSTENKPSTSRGADYSRPSTSRGVSSSNQNRPEPAPHIPHIVYGPYMTHINARGDSILVRRTMSHSVSPISIHIFNGELVPRLPLDEPTIQLPDYPHPLSQINQTFSQPNFNPLLPASTYYHTMKAETLITEKKLFKEGNSSNEGSTEPISSTSTSASCVEPPRSMIWSEEAACDKQITQIGVSACGATAVVNVFNALDVPVDVDRINTAVGTRQRANTAKIPRYILSRAVAGCTAADLINGIQISSGGLVTARFFPTYPERAMSLSHFLSDWISLGAVPILTLNLQISADTQIPDAWHHQMVFGVSSQGIFLSNPLECVRENNLWPRLVSPSVLLVRAKDVVSRFTEDTDLGPLMYVPDARFHTLNVFGQVANVLRESRMPWRQDSNPRTHHIRIPAAYQAGITIAVLTGTEAHRRLMIAPQLPLLDNRWTEQNDPA